MVKGMFVPVVLAVSVVAMLSGLLSAFNYRVMQHNAGGRPFDHLGDGIKCAKCGVGGVKAERGYWYSCPHCHEHYRMRLAEDSSVEVW